MLTLESMNIEPTTGYTPETVFVMILGTVTNKKEYLVKTLENDEGWGGSEYTSILFPKNEMYEKDDAGYFEDGVQFAFFTPGSEKMFNGKEEVYSYTMSYEVAYRYLKLGCNSLIKKYPEYKQEIEEACKVYKERHNIEEENPDFNYNDIFGNMKNFLIWLW